MNKLLEYGRTAWFFVRVITGYEERSLRAHRLQLEKHLREAQARKAALQNVPEKAILSEVRQMVEEMKKLNKLIEDTEAQIEDYFKPIDKEAQKIMNMQFDSEETRMKEMLKTMQRQSLLEEAEVERKLKADHTDKNQGRLDEGPITKQEAQTR